MLTEGTIRNARAADHDVLVALWERSVRATHSFLTEEDITLLRPLVGEELRSDAMQLWVLADAADVPWGVLGVAGPQVAALFLEPHMHRRGGGSRLVAHAQALWGGALTVDVNEENASARAFYEKLGFSSVGRSAVDDSGRPFPLIHLRRPAPAASESGPKPLSVCPALFEHR